MVELHKHPVNVMSLNKKKMGPLVVLVINASICTALLLTVQSEAVVGTGEDLASPTECHLFVEIILQD